MGGDNINIDSMIDFLDGGGVDQRIFDLSTAAPLGKSKDNSP